MFLGFYGSLKVIRSEQGRSCKNNNINSSVNHFFKSIKSKETILIRHFHPLPPGPMRDILLLHKETQVPRHAPALTASDPWR